MILHNIKIAFHYMWKYKNQTLISVLGLTFGFTCFSLATLWIRYETTYDSFHKNAKQMYVVYSQDRDDPSRVKHSFQSRWANYLKETFPEIADVTTVSPGSRDFKVNIDDMEYPARVIFAESSYPRMFDVKLIEGNWDCFIPDSRKIAITQEKARQIFGEQNPIGEKIGSSLEISAVVSGISDHSNFVFDIIYSSTSTGFSGYPVIELFKGTDVEAFEKKLYDHTAGEGVNGISKLRIMPVTKLHYSDPTIERDVKFEYIVIFSISGLLVILCSLFNYLTLFVSRFRMRQKELALRMVCGASGRSLLVMLSVEFMITLAFSVAAGCLLTQLLYEPFLKISYISMGLLSVYRETLLYIGCVILFSMLALWLVLFLFRRRSLNLSIRWSNKKLFRKVSVVSQLAISIGFAFCALVIVKQIYFLYYSGEIGLSFKNRASIYITFLSRESIPIEGASNDVFVNQLRQIPEITEIVPDVVWRTLATFSNSGKTRIFSWDEQPAADELIDLSISRISPASIPFYDLQLVAGEMITDADPESVVMLNEAAVKAFGWQDAVGKTFVDALDELKGDDGLKTVKGVLKNIYYSAPTKQIQPTYYRRPEPPTESRLLNGNIYFSSSLTFKYREGMWESCREKIDRLIEKEYPELRRGNLTINNIEEEYKDYLKSENALLRLLSFVAAICVLICVFGFVSLVSLVCEERRKSIAIRKVHGATIGDIITIFAKEYSLLLLVGAVIAFAGGYFIMQRWLEQYAIHTNIPVWLYLSILFVMASVIIVCVGRQVYKTSIENPANVINKE